MLRKAFTNHRPSDEGVARILELRKAFSAAADLIESVCPASRERSVAMTELENACMWAVKSIVLNDPNSVPTPDGPRG
jgi:hypothetical protein